MDVDITLQDGKHLAHYDAKRVFVTSTQGQIVDLTQNQAGFFVGGGPSGSDVELLKQVNAQANTIAELRKRVAEAEADLAHVTDSRGEWIMRTKIAEAQLAELRWAFKVLVRGGKED